MFNIPRATAQSREVARDGARSRKGRRLQTIITLQEAQSATITGPIGSTTEVLIEGRPGGGRLEPGKSPQFKTVVFPADGTAWVNWFRCASPQRPRTR